MCDVICRCGGFDPPFSLLIFNGAYQTVAILWLMFANDWKLNGCDGSQYFLTTEDAEKH
jgi:hypothetical protein